MCRCLCVCACVFLWIDCLKLQSGHSPAISPGRHLNMHDALACLVFLSFNFVRSVLSIRCYHLIWPEPWVTWYTCGRWQSSSRFSPLCLATQDACECRSPIVWQCAELKRNNVSADGEFIKRRGFSLAFHTAGEQSCTAKDFVIHPHNWLSIESRKKPWSVHKYSLNIKHKSRSVMR